MDLSSPRPPVVGKYCENFENVCSKFNRKFEFLTIFGKFVTNNIAFENNIIFLQIFFGLGGFPPFPALLILLSW